LVLGIFFGLLSTIFCASFCVNLMTLNFFTVSSDASHIQTMVRQHLYRNAYDFNTVSNVVGYVLCAIALYICV